VRREKARLVYLSNPDNPMGSWWEGQEILRFIEALPETCVLVLDEAYGETAPASALPPIDVSRPNVVRMRTFSKAYGLAGIRCGYAFGDADVIASFEKVRNHYGVNRMAQIAGETALADQDYLAGGGGEGGSRTRPARADRPGERAPPPALGDQLCDDRLRRRSGPRPLRDAQPACARCLHPQADGSGT
jgi:hypothetical protein